MRHRDGLIHIIHSTPHLQLPHVSPTTYFLFATYAVLRQGGEKGIIMRQEGSTSPYAILQTCINTQLIHFHAQNKVWLPQTCIMRHNPLRGKETTSEPHVMSASFCFVFLCPWWSKEKFRYACACVGSNPTNTIFLPTTSYSHNRFNHKHLSLPYTHSCHHR